MIAILAVVLAAGLAGALAGASPATAHAVLRSSTPAAGGVPDRAPHEVVLGFSEAPLAVGSVVKVTSSSGAVVSTGKAEVVGHEVRQALVATEAGSHRVDWRVTSSDGHPISDTFTFTVTTGSDPAGTGSVTPPTQAPPSAGTPADAGHHGSGVHAGDELAFTHVAGTVVILLLGVLGCAISLRRDSALRDSALRGTAAAPRQ